jgi:hypothetical protein
MQTSLRQHQEQHAQQQQEQQQPPLKQHSWGCQWQQQGPRQELLLVVLPLGLFTQQGTYSSSMQVVLFSAQGHMGPLGNLHCTACFQGSMVGVLSQLQHQEGHLPALVVQQHLGCRQLRRQQQQQ